MSIQNNSQHLNLDAFQSMIGTEKSTGYVGLDSKGNLTKAAAHRTLTSLNKAELAKLKNDPLDNKYIRTCLFNAVKSHVAQKAESNPEQRIAALQFAAQKLGMQIDVSRGFDNVKIRGVSDQPLERRDIRSIIGVARSSKLQSILVPQESDKVYTADSGARREALIDAMKLHFPGINWKELPMEQLTNESLRLLGMNLLKGNVKTWGDFKMIASELARANSTEKINSESVIHRIEHAKDHPTNQVTFTAPQQAPNTEAKFLFKQSEADTTKFLEQAPQVDQALLGEDGNPLSRKEVHQKLEKDLQIPSEETVNGRSFSTQKGIDVQGIIQGKNGEAEMVVSHFIESFIDATSQKDVDMQALLLGHKRALAVIVGSPQAKFDAMFDAIPNGALMKPSFAEFRQSALKSVSQSYSESKIGSFISNFVQKTPETLSAKGLNSIELGELIDALDVQLKDNWDVQSEESDAEELSEVEDEDQNAKPMSLKETVETAVETVREKLETQASNEIKALAEDPESAGPMLADLRVSLSNVLQSHRTDSVENTAKALMSTLMQKEHTQALTLLLCHTDKTLQSFGNAALLKPVLDGLKAKLNTLVKADLVQEGLVGENATIDFFRPEYAGRMQAELTTKLGELANDPTLFAGIEGSVLTEGQVSTIVLDSLRMLFDTLTGASNTQLTETTQTLHDVKEEDVRDVLANFFLEKETWVSDEERVPGTRLQQMFSKDLDTLSVILCNPEKCAKMLGFGEIIHDTLEALKDTLKPLDTLFAPGNEAMARIALGKIATTLTLEQFATMQKGIDRATQEAMATLQTLMGSAFEALLHGEDVGDLDEILATAKEDEAFVKDCRDSGMDQATIDELLKQRHIDRADAKEFEKSIEGQDLQEEEVLTLRAAFNQKKTEQRAHEEQLKTLQGDALNTYVAEHKAQGEAAFNEKLDAMTLKDGFDLWAKRECYDKESRAALKKKFFSDHDVNETIATIRDGQSFTALMNAYIEENNLRPSKFKEPETMNAQEKAVWLLKEAELEEITGKGALDTSSGYGKFMVEVMKNYFAKVPTIDKKSMIASLIRQGKVLEAPENATPEQVEQMAKDNLARQLGALFKGAGPVMQKLLQQLGSTEVSKEFKLALEDMKMNLLPIPKEVVAVQLQNRIDAYNATHPQGEKITSINVNKSLGAASVAQTLLCTVTFEDGSSRPLAVKVLRPDAQNRIDREKDIFLEVARTVPGMEQTYLGRLERVMEEVDLTLEAANVEKGKVYDKSLKLDGTVHTDVKSMKLDPTIPSTSDVMILECAPGVTVAELLQENDAKLQRIRTQAEQLKIAANNTVLVQELDQSIAELEAKQRELVHLSHKWVEEGLFKSGFYHGDLHAGNIMVDRLKPGEVDKGLTVIDFGNATALSKDDQGCIMRMVYGAGNNDARLFLDNYRALLKPESLAHFDEVRAQAQERLEAIFQKGDGDNVGQCILGAVTELQKLDLELPAQIFNFSQCQILLQGTLEQVNAQLSAFRSTREELWNRNNPLSGNTVTDFTVVKDQIGKNIQDPQALTRMRELIDGRVSEYKAKVVEFLKDNAGALQEFLAENPQALGEDEALKAKHENLTSHLDSLTAETLSDVETATFFGRFIQAFRQWERTEKGLEVEDPLIQDADRMVVYCTGINVWEKERAHLEDFRALSGIQAQVDLAREDKAQIDEQHISLNRLIGEIKQLGEGIVVPENALTLEDKDIVRLLKGKNSKAQMMSALNDELNRLRQLAKPNAEEQALFETVKKFRDSLLPMPENYLPRPKLTNVEKASHLIYDDNRKVNTKAGLLATFTSMKTDRETQIANIKAQSIFPFATKENIAQLKAEMDAVKAMQVKANDVIDFAPSEICQQIHAVWEPKAPQIPQGQTKDQVLNMLQRMINSLDSPNKEIAKLQGDIDDRFSPAIEEIMTSAKDWPDNTPLLSMPKVPSKYVAMLHGQPMTRENLLGLLEPIFQEVRTRSDECNDHLNELNLQLLAQGDLTNRLVDLSNGLSNADSFYEDHHAPNPDYDNPKSFLNVMGGVIKGHKVKAALAVGLGTAIKALFS